MAPYLPLGCVQPLVVSRVNIGSSYVEVALQKPHSTRRSVNVTLELAGNDKSNPLEWKVIGHSLLAARSPWIELPVESELVEASSIWDAGGCVIVPLVLTSANLREQAAAYKETLLIQVRSGQIERTSRVEVTLVPIPPPRGPLYPTLPSPQAHAPSPSYRTTTLYVP